MHVARTASGYASTINITHPKRLLMEIGHLHIQCKTEWRIWRKISKSTSTTSVSVKSAGRAQDALHSTNTEKLKHCQKCPQIQRHLGQSDWTDDPFQQMIPAHMCTSLSTYQQPPWWAGSKNKKNKNMRTSKTAWPSANAIQHGTRRLQMQSEQRKHRGHVSSRSALKTEISEVTWR